MAAGTIMPPSEAATGIAASRRLDNWPTVNSRLISSPTTRKKMVSSPSLTQRMSVSVKPPSSQMKPMSCCHIAARAGAKAVLLSSSASKVATSSRMPDDGVQFMKSRAAARTR
jgi:hypothetical protein